jgi:hypothetical protein
LIRLGEPGRQVAPTLFGAPLDDLAAIALRFGGLEVEGSL